MENFRFNELIFENRNRNYGAYMIRKNYDKRVIVSALLTLTFFVVCAIGPAFFHGVREIVLNKTTDSKVKMVNIILEEKSSVTPPKKETVVQENKSERPKANPTLPVTPTDSEKVAHQDSTDHQLPFNPDGDPRGKDTTGQVTSHQNGNTKVPLTGNGKKEVHDYVDVNPEFPGGIPALMKFLRDNIHYPEMEKENGVSGTVYFNFVVDENGKITNISSLNNPGEGLVKEAKRVIAMMPDWKPGVYQGEKVPTNFKLPVKFSLK